MLEEKIKQLKKELKEKRDLYNTALTEATDFVKRDLLDDAKAKKDEIEALKAEIEQKSVELMELEALIALQPYEEEEEQTQERGRKAKMADKTKNFEAFIRTQGTEKRDLDSTNGGVVIPEEISRTAFEPKREEFDLSSYVYTQNVGAPSGKIPVATNNNSVLSTKAELAEIADVDVDLFLEIAYNIETRAGRVVLSNELIEDAEISVVDLVKKALRRMVKNTNNAGVIAKLKTFTKVTAGSVDDVKRVMNVDIDPSLNKKVLMNQDAFNYFDTLKDAEGKYLLQADISSATGKAFFGNEVIVVPNALMANTGTKFNIFIGDLESAVGIFTKKQVEAQWEKFDNYSKGLSIVVRNDYQVVDPEAGRLVEFTPEAPAAG